MSGHTPRDPHASHPDVDLTLAEHRPDGTRIFQTWTICACGLAGLRERLGPPQQESVQTPETLAATARVALSVPGVLHMFAGEQQDGGVS